MAKLSLNKSTMLRESRQLKSYERFLPSLDLKRKQLISELGKARESRRRIEQEAASLRLHLEREVAKRRESVLHEAVRKATQRVNLVEKVLSPRSRAHIKKIRIALSDEERAAVVRSKIAKRKRAAEGLS